jgi:hypothetical protein
MTTMHDENETTAAWDRTAYEPGGDAALVFYVIYATASVAPTLSIHERHRTNGLPDGVNLVVRGRTDPNFTVADYTVGSSPAARAAAASADLQFVLAGLVADPPDLMYLRDVLGVAAALLDAGATAVFDLQTMRLWTADEFMRDVFERDAPTREMHVAFLESDDTREGHAWIHTRGLRKFGRPDISVRVPHALAAEAALLAHSFAEIGIRGAIVPEGMPIAKAGWPDGWTCHHGGTPDDPEFNNRHIELRPPASPAV